MPWERIVYKRGDLFDQVWAEPVREVAKRMNISDVALAKVCRGMSIPLPGRGYWARKAAGNAPPKPNLPAAKSGAKLTYVQNRLVPDPVEAKATAAILEEVERSVREEPALVSAATPSEQHPLVVRSALILQKASRRLGVVLNHRRCLDVLAHGEALDRGLRIMDAVLKALEARGYRIEVTSPNSPKTPSTAPAVPSRTLVHIGESVIQIGIDEAIQKVPLPLPAPPKPRTPYEYVPRPKRQFEYRPTGRLHLRIKNGNLRGAPTMWGDRKGVRVEEYLNEFVASVVVAAERQRLDRIEAERRRLAALAQERRNKAVALQNEAHDVLEQDLKTRLADWRFARDLEAFANAVRIRMTSAGRPIQPESPVGTWLEWAAVVGRYYDKRAIDRLMVLREHERGYELKAKFGWGHKLTTRDALKVFFAPIEQLVQELVADADRQD